ncbi:hypothetical protein M1403_02930 [Patescibacteria group bacterium]|nr:hypothetical protein [Patescibacteria group bacterium]
MHWPSFFKGSFLFLFLLFFSLTGASLAFQVHQEQIIANSNHSVPVYLAQAKIPAASGHFAAVLGTATMAEPLKDTSILLLGLDSRKGDKSARCDAIHTVSFLPSQGKIIITSVPRGTISKDGNIIANVCSIYGFDTAKKEIEKITGIPADYTVKTGFSQTMGAFRLLGLPPSPTLQFLRDRHDYAIGDNQRSFNQANFLKDMLVQHLDQINALPEPIKYLGFKTIDTDISYNDAKKLLAEIIASGIYKDPANIEVVVKPADNLVRQDIHLSAQTATDWSFSQDPEYQAYQKEMVDYLENITKTANKTAVITALAQKSWLQVDDPGLRNQLHFDLLKIVPTPDTLKDFILEMSQAGQPSLQQQAEEILASLKS